MKRKNGEITHVMKIFFCAALLLFGGNGMAETVSLLSHTDHSFEIASGEYRIRYDVGKDNLGWINITRDGHEGAIGTKLAQGDHLDVTAGCGSPEKSIYGWAGDVRKDSRVFRSMTCRETAEAVEVTILSERQWAKFESRLIADKTRPGLLRWTVTAHAKEDKAFSGDATPDAHFVTTNLTSNWERMVSHDVVRYSVQRGPTCGAVYFRDLPMKSFVFYFEDFSSLNDLYRLTGCDNPYNYPPAGNPGAVKMGEASHWFQQTGPDENNPQPLRPFAGKVEKFKKFGYERPLSYRVPKDTRLILADTYLYLRPAVQTDNVTVCRNFTEMLAGIYPSIRKPPQIRTDWQGEVMPQLLRDLMRPENTTVYKDTYHLPRAYVGYEHADMQLWNLLQLLHPLEFYVKKHPDDSAARKLRDRLDAALPLYWDKDIHWFRNSPAPIPTDTFDDIVYQMTVSGMLADVAVLGNENARAILLDSRSRLLQMGKACGYTFANYWVKDFSKMQGIYPADAIGMYMYLMMALYELSDGRDARALDAAKAAADKIAERCLDFGYEVNMTSGSAVACERLYQATGEQRYRDLAFIPLANTLQQAWLWECDYGVGEYTTTFWSFSGCPGAPCTAEFENHRARLAFRNYLQLAGESVSPAVARMLDDSWRYGMTQARFALPPFLVAAGAKKFIAAEGPSQTNCGEIRYDQMIPIEDIRVGWGTDIEWWQNNAKLGVVGQELYGAGGLVWYALWQADLE